MSTTAAALYLTILLSCFSLILTKSSDLNDDLMHPKLNIQPARKSDEENTAEFWQSKASKTVEEIASRQLNTNIAKNVILFLGDGMSVPTLAATRVYIGGENSQLSFDKFPNTALSKTYCVDMQVADSACTATAYLTGIKGNYGTIGVTGNVKRGDCEAMANTTNHVQSIAYWSQKANKATGLVTTATVTHASPSGVFAHTSERGWESNTPDPDVCTDIATQLVTWEPGSNLNVIMGGGRGNFLPKEVTDDEGDKGNRNDGVDLIQTWLNNKNDAQEPAQYVWNRDQLLNLDDRVTNVLGLFESGFCNWNLEADPELDPSLSEMTEAAIKVLSKNENGYFLFVEGARIDMGHHEGHARKALDETAEFSRAIELAVNMTSEEDTLIVVTSDHAHTMTFSGYSEREHDVLGLNGQKSDVDGLPYTTLSYANGPGYKERQDISDDNLEDINYAYAATVPMGSESHGGDDVAVFARGPRSHLFAGVIEQNVIPALMSYVSCVGEGPQACDQLK